jgi:hypothetical protein
MAARSKRRAKAGRLGHDELARLRKLHPIADKVRTFYIMSYRQHVENRDGTRCTYGMYRLDRWDGGYDEKGKWCEPTWIRIVEFALEHKVNPISLVRETFAAWKSKFPPYPNQFATPSALLRVRTVERTYDRFAEDLALSDQTFRAAASSYHLHGGMSLDAAVTRVLNEPTNGLTPLYRYCMAARGGLDSVAARYAEQAFIDYILDKPAYDATWGDLITETLRQQAEDFLREVL